MVGFHGHISLQRGNLQQKEFSTLPLKLATFTRATGGGISLHLPKSSVFSPLELLDGVSPSETFGAYLQGSEFSRTCK